MSGVPKQSAQGIGEVCDRLGLSYQSAVQRAVRMRDHGVALKKFTRHGSVGFDWADLRKIAEDGMGE